MLTIVNKKTWQTCDFPVWERVKHIVPVYNNKESGQNPAHYITLNTVMQSSRDLFEHQRV